MRSWSIALALKLDKMLGSTEIWTRIARFRVLSANHYTMEPLIFLKSFTIKVFRNRLNLPGVLRQRLLQTFFGRMPIQTFSKPEYLAAGTRSISEAKKNYLPHQQVQV